MIDKPTYYGILPANVRYDKRLSDFARVLYTEITALSNKNGYCNAKNSYFVKLFEKTDRTISRTITQLHDYKYIRIVGEGKQRKIYPNDQNATPTKMSKLDKNVNKPRQKCPTNPDKNVYPYTNNTRDNITSSNNDNARERASVVDFNRLFDLLKIQLGDQYFDSLSKREFITEKIAAHGIFKMVAGRIGQDENEPENIEQVYQAFQEFITGLSKLEWWKDRMNTTSMIQGSFTKITQRSINQNGKAAKTIDIAQQVADELRAEGW